MILALHEQQRGDDHCDRRFQCHQRAATGEVVIEPKKPATRSFDRNALRVCPLRLKQQRLRAREVEIGAEILHRIGRDFAKTVEWLLTGEG